MSCFQKVDAEVGGLHEGNGETTDNRLEPIASEAVGSTAVVAIVCPTHIIVANCGDSRAVLCRGKIALPLSVDHKVWLMFVVFASYYYLLINASVHPN